MKRHLLKFKRALLKTISKASKSLGFLGYFKIGVVGLLVVGAISFATDYNEKVEKAEAYDRVQQAKKVSETITVSTSIPDNAIKQAQKDLKEAKETMIDLGAIRLINDQIKVFHDIEKKDGKKRIYMAIEAYAKFSSFLYPKEIDFELSDDGLEIIASIPRLTIDKGDVYLNREKPIEMLAHPEPGRITTDDKPKNWFTKWYKRDINNDNLDGFVSVEEVMTVEEELYNTFSSSALDVINKDFLNVASIIREYEDIALKVVESIYNPEIEGKSITNKKGEILDIELPSNPLKTPVKARFKDDAK